MATNDFKVFANDEDANTMTQDAYLNGAYIHKGLAKGIADSKTNNKVLHQATTMAALLGQFIITTLTEDCLDDGDVEAKLDQFNRALKLLVKDSIDAGLKLNWIDEDYDPARVYQINDALGWNGSSYVCIAPSSGHTPDNESFWDLMAERGDDGITPQLSIGTVTTLNNDQPATGVISGNIDDLKLDLGIPKGKDGQINKINGITPSGGDFELNAPVHWDPTNAPFAPYAHNSLTTATYANLSNGLSYTVDIKNIWPYHSDLNPAFELRIIIIGGTNANLVIASTASNSEYIYNLDGSYTKLPITIPTPEAMCVYKFVVNTNVTAPYLIKEFPGPKPVVTTIVSGQSINPLTASAGTYVLDTGAVLTNAPTTIDAFSNVVLTVYEKGAIAKLSHLGYLNVTEVDRHTIIATDWMLFPRGQGSSSTAWRWMGDNGDSVTPLASGSKTVLSIPDLQAYWN